MLNVYEIPFFLLKPTTVSFSFDSTHFYVFLPKSKCLPIAFYALWTFYVPHDSITCFSYGNLVSSYHRFVKKYSYFYIFLNFFRFSTKNIHTHHMDFHNDTILHSNIKTLFLLIACCMIMEIFPFFSIFL